MNKPLLFTILFAVTTQLPVFAQDFLGLRSSPYGGVTNVDYNPAIADSRFLLDINLIGASATVNNNFAGIDRHALFHPSLFSDTAFRFDHIKQRLNGKDKDVFLNAQITGPLSFMVSFGKGKEKNKNAFAFSYHSNFIVNVDHLSEEFVRIAYLGTGYQAEAATGFIGQKLTDSHANVRYLAWNDYDLTYSRVIIDNDAHMLKVGGTLKLLQGLAGGYMYVNNLQYQWPKYDTISFSGDAKYAYSEGTFSSQGYPANNLSSYVGNYFNFQYAPPSAAVDLGAIYEWRPNKSDYKYTMDCEDQWRIDKNRYKLAAGLSIIDIGGIRFKEGANSGDVSANIQNWDVHDAKFPDGLQSIDDSIHAHWAVNHNNFFTMWLPTRINAFIDYNIAYGLGLNGAAMISPNMAPNRNMVHEVTTFSVTPKYENSWFGAYLPVSYDIYGNFNLGLTLRAGPLIIGTQDILGLFAKKFLYNADVHMALKITIPYHKIRDRDKDGVSNKLDLCPKEKGDCASHGCPDRDHDGIMDDQDRCPDTPGPIELHGCPDTDGDGIVDIDDSCPLDPGLAKYHGCPDRDSDGIIDKLDECPDQPGLPQFNGCPDTDSDGIPDKLDLCPTLPGPPEHHGCPDTDKDGVFDDVDRCPLTPGPKENQGCPWPDRDGDGIPDKDDECPDVFGVPENHGCPALAKKDIETIKYAFENLEFETGKSIIRQHSFASLNSLANLLIEKKNYGLRIEGHTDNVGTDEKNLILSHARADAVRDYLIKRGVDGGKLEAFGYGASKPVADNDTPAGRQKNRRVEMKITFK